MLLGGAENAEAVDHLVGHKVGVGVPGLSVLVVVVTLATLDVVGEGGRHVGVLAVALDDVGDMVADHAAEPAGLVAHVGHVVADIGGGGDADGDLIGVTAGAFGGGAHRVDGPLGDGRVGELEDEPLAGLADERQGLRPVAGAPDLESRLGGPGQGDGGAVVVDLASIGELADDGDGLAHGGEGGRPSVGDADRRVAAPDSAHGPVAVHLVERRVGARGDGPVAGGRVGHHRADDDVAGLGQDLAVDHVGLLPQDVGVEGPDVAEPEGLGPLREFDDAERRRGGLEDDADVHDQRVSGKPRLIELVDGSGQREVTTLPRV